MLTNTLKQATRFQTIRNIRCYSNRTLSAGEKLIHDKLTNVFKPKSIEVTDISGGCGSMYSIQLQSDLFKGKGLVQQHRMVNEVLKDDIKDMHGLQLKTSS